MSRRYSVGRYVRNGLLGLLGAGIVAGLVAIGIAVSLVGWIFLGVMVAIGLGVGGKKIYDYRQKKKEEEAKKVAEEEEKKKEAKKEKDYKDLEELYESYGCISEKDAEKYGPEEKKAWKRAQDYKQERKNAYFKFDYIRSIKLTTRDAARVLTNDEFRDWRKYLAVKKEREDAKEVYNKYKDMSYEKAKTLAQSEFKKWDTVQDLKKEKEGIAAARKARTENPDRYKELKDLMILKNDKDEVIDVKSNKIKKLLPEEKELFYNIVLLDRFEFKEKVEKFEKLYDENKGLLNEQEKKKLTKEELAVWQMVKNAKEKDAYTSENKKVGDFKDNGHKLGWQYAQIHETECDKEAMDDACEIYVKFKHIQTESEALKLCKEEYNEWDLAFGGYITWGENGSLKGFKYEGKYDPEEIYDKYKNIKEEDAELTLDREEFKKWDFAQSLKKAKEKYELKQLEINNENKNDIIENKISGMNMNPMGNVNKNPNTMDNGINKGGNGLNPNPTF